MIYFESNHSLYMFGGGNSSQMFNDLFIFDISTNSWTMPAISGDAPNARTCHAAVKINENSFLIIGGGDLQYVYNDIRMFSIDRNTWSTMRLAGSHLSKRAGHSASLVGQKILVFGGGDVDGCIFSDFYSLDLSYMVSNKA